MKLMMSIKMGLFLGLTSFTVISSFSMESAMVKMGEHVQQYKPVPASIASKAVYHVKAQELNDFSCGYNTLFNACNVDKVCGIANEFSDYDLFAKTSRAYANSMSLNPTGSLSNHDVDDLSTKHLKMKNVCFLAFKDNKIIPLVKTPIQIKLTGRESSVERVRLVKQEFEKKQEEFLTSIRHQFDAAAGLTRVMHFVCAVSDTGIGHAILISVVQNSTGRGIYIFDNMNRRIDENTHIMRYVHSLSARFSVSAKAIFKGPKVPDVWPTLIKRSKNYDLALAIEALRRQGVGVARHFDASKAHQVAINSPKTPVVTVQPRQTVTKPIVKIPVQTQPQRVVQVKPALQRAQVQPAMQQVHVRVQPVKPATVAQQPKGPGSNPTHSISRVSVTQRVASPVKRAVPVARPVARVQKLTPQQIAARRAALVLNKKRAVAKKVAVHKKK